MIGIFDSGVGGLTVVKEIFRNLPQYQTIYFGDSARLPYGTRGADFVKKYSDKITGWLLENKAEIIVVACNTASAWASDSLRKKYKGTAIFDMITPAISAALETTKNNKIGVIGTPGMIKSGIYQKKLLAENRSLEIYPVACPLFVPLVEEGWVDDEITKQIVRVYLNPLKDKGIDTLVLGCTHYPLLEDTIEKIIDSGIKIVNPAKTAALEVKKYLEDNPDIEKQVRKGDSHQFFFSDEPYNLEKISNLCLGYGVKPVIRDPFS
ncbi:MAG: glutamate racemase [Candidatus Nealsonbacteria bacterium]|nr:glutamate racemase [Candidatus Nealsonbacteria bacterium]